MNRSFPHRLYKISKAFYHNVPSQKATWSFVDALTGFLCPLQNGDVISEENMCRQWENLYTDFLNLIQPLCKDENCTELADRFFEKIPLIFTGLAKDAEMFFRSDPAAYGIEEVILCYPGFYAVMTHRIAHAVLELGIPILPRVISEYTHSKTGIDIHPGATIGRNFYIDHGTGIVIGETTVIGKNVKIYQGVTLGAAFVNKDMEGKKRHPTIEDNVIIYAGSTILGGQTVIGHDTVIGGNVWLTESVPAHSKVYHQPEVIIKGNK